jgi:hypothetical protein
MEFNQCFILENLPSLASVQSSHPKLMLKIHPHNDDFDKFF